MQVQKHTHKRTSENEQNCEQTICHEELSKSLESHGRFVRFLQLDYEHVPSRLVTHL